MGSNPSARVPGRILPFLIAFVVGTAAMVLLRMMLPDPPWIGALCAALAACAAIVMLGAWYYRSDSPRDLDRAGDNLYYLGFLFTLISLIHALINLFLFEESGADLADRTYTLIGSLGIALMSTVAGILGRIILHDKSEDRTFPDDPPYPHPDPDEAPAAGRPAEGIASREGNEGRNVPYGIPEHGYLRNDAVFGGTEAGLHLLVRRLRAEIRDATGAFSHFNRMTMLQAEDTKRHAERMVREFSTKLETDARDTVIRTGDTYRNLVGQAHTAGDAFEDRIGKAVGAFTTVLEQLSAASHALSELPANVEQVRRSMDVLDEAAKAVTSRLDDETSEIKEACEILARTAREQRTIMAQSTEFAGTLSTLTEQLGAATRAFAEIPGNMERTRTGVDSLSEAMNAVVTGLGDKAGELARASDSLARSAREQRAIIAQSMEITSAFSNLVRQLGSVDHSLAALPANVEQVRRSMDVLDEAAKAVTSRLDDETSEIKEVCEILARTAREQRTIMAQSIEFAGSLSTLTEQLGAASRAFSEIPGNMERTRIGVDSLSEAMNAVVTGLDDKTGELARASDSLARSAHEQRASIAQSMEITSAFSNLVRQLGSVDHSLAALPANVARAQQSMEAFGKAADDSKDNIHIKAGEVIGAFEILTHGVREQQQNMERILEAARTMNMRVDSEGSEWIRSFEELRIAFKVVPRAADALAALVEQLESVTRSLANFSENMKRIEKDRSAPDDGSSPTTATFGGESAGPSSRRPDQRRSWFRKKT